MTDTVETLRADLDALKTQFDNYVAYAKPIIDIHQPKEDTPATAASSFMPLSNVVVPAAAMTPQPAPPPPPPPTPAAAAAPPTPYKQP